MQVQTGELALVPSTGEVRPPKRRRATLEIGFAKKFLKQTGGSIKAIVLSRLPVRNSTPGKKAPPVSTRVCIVSTSAEVPYVQTEQEQGAIDPVDLTRGSCIWYGAFDLSPNVQAGSLVTLVKPRAATYEGQARISGTMVILNEGSPGMLDKELPPELLQLPGSLGQLIQQANILLVFNPSPYARSKFQSVGFMQGYQHLAGEIYRGKKRDGTEYKTAYIHQFGGYPMEIECGEGANRMKCYGVVRFYENHFEDFGIASADAWEKFAAYFFDYFSGYLFAYVDSNATKALEANLSGQESHEPDAEDMPYRYVFTVKCNRLVFDLKEMIQRIGFEVDADYVREHFANRAYVESMFAEGNKLWKTRARSEVLNLSEYSGYIGQIYSNDKDKWRFYALIDYGDSVSDDTVVGIRHGNLSCSERSIALRDPQKIKYQMQYIYAIRK